MRPGERRGGRLALRLAAALLAALALFSDWEGAAPTRRHAPQLIVDDSVGADLEALARETWGRFLVFFRARQGCFGDVRLHAARALDSRAGYDPASATVTVQVPGTPAMLESALVHEWAHHVEFQCNAHQSLRPAFLAAQGLPADTPWRPEEPAPPTTGDWSALPSEQYAEAVVEAVLGGRPVPTWVRVSPQAVAVVEAWASGH